jgi:hypothetical protein
MSRRQATFVVITFLLSALLLSQLAIWRARVDPFSLQPIIRAEGTIVAKDRSAEGHGIVKLEVAVKGAEPMFASWEIPDPYWTSLSPKDRIAVVYQLNNTGTAIRVIECGIVALPDEIR